MQANRNLGTPAGHLDAGRVADPVYANRKTTTGVHHRRTHPTTTAQFAVHGGVTIVIWLVLSP